MKEPWKIRTDDFRTADSLPTFIIFCEDGEIEPEYFLCFATEKIKVSPIRNCGKHHSQIDFATDHCRANDLLEIVEGKEILKLDEGAQVWCVFDRDREPNDNRDTSFTNSIDTAELKGFRTAWSNDDFELWFLLHFEDVDPSLEEYKSREKYYERLTHILKNATPLTEAEIKVTKREGFDYYQQMKSRKKFITITLQHLKGKTEIAIGRSKVIEKFHESTPKPHHLKSPCTKVHYLIEELIKFGGKMV